uniref:ISY1 splicing factor homolog n=1 Tax=Felis catus TaxID=9685 RepID=A0ABI7WVY3_FELCA
MARNAEKAMTALARFRQAQLEEGKVKERRPFLASECTELPKAEKWRRQIIGEISKKVAQIQNAGLGEFRIRDLNDEINKLLREKGHWEVRIKELGGPDYGSGPDWWKSGKLRERPGWQEEKRRRRRKRRKRSTSMLSPRKSLTRKAARRKEVKTGSRSSSPMSQCRHSKRSRRPLCEGRRWNSSRSTPVRPCRPRVKRPKDFWGIRSEPGPVQGLEICQGTIIPCWPLPQGSAVLGLQTGRLAL